MSTYYVKIDEKGRILLPKAMRSMFEKYVKIEHEEGSNVATLTSLKRGFVVAEADVINSAYELVQQAWQHNVTLMPVGTTNGNDVIHVYGQYADVKRYFETLGYDKDFDDYIVEERRTL